MRILFVVSIFALMGLTSYSQDIITLAKLDDNRYTEIDSEVVIIRKDIIKGHDLRFGLGLVSSLNVYDGFASDTKYFDGYNKFISGYDLIQVGSSGMLDITYSYLLKERIAVGLSLNYMGFYHRFFPDDKRIAPYTDSYHVSIISPIVRYYWFKSEFVRMYSSASLGVMFINKDINKPDSESNTTSLNLSGHVNLFGLSVGRQFYGYIETLGIGTQALISIGFGYRFFEK